MTRMATAVARRVTPKNLHQSFLRYSYSLSKPSHHNDHKQNQEYLQPTPFIGSWDAPKDPKAAQAKLAQLRCDYAKQVKDLRKHYSHEMELQRQDELRKDEARREEVRREREQRSISKAAAAKARAAERKAFEEEFRQTLMKERGEKLEYWRMRQKAIDEKKRSKEKLISQQSSMWIDEGQLEAKLLNVIVDNATHL